MPHQYYKLCLWYYTIYCGRPSSEMRYNVVIPHNVVAQPSNWTGLIYYHYLVWLLQVPDTWSSIVESSMIAM